MQVYKITNLINNKSYIGVTKRNFYVRYNYRNDWWNAPSVNLYLKNSVKKYGSENFSVEILENCTFEEEIYFLEKYYIKFYNTQNSNFGYNFTSGGDKGYNYSESTNEKNRLAHLGKPGKGKNVKGHKKPLERINKQKETIKARYSTGNLIVWNKGKRTGPMSKITVKKSAEAHKKAVICTDLQGNFIKEYQGLIDTKIDGFNPSQVSLCCKHPKKYKTHRNCKFMYKGNNL